MREGEVWGPRAPFRKCFNQVLAGRNPAYDPFLSPRV